MNTNINSPIDRLQEAELEKCKDPVYFYENYFLVDGKKPAPLREFEKEMIRKVNDGYSIRLKRGKYDSYSYANLLVKQENFKKALSTMPDFLKQPRYLPAIITKQ